MRPISRKVALIICLLTMTVTGFSPTNGVLTIVDTFPIQPYSQLINAIGMVEAQYDTLAYNPLEEAAGYFQIRPIRVEDYNRRTGSNYTLEDMFDYYIAEKIFLYYASQVGPYDFERIAKSWNGSGPMTIDYWKSVRKHL